MEITLRMYSDEIHKPLLDNYVMTSNYYTDTPKEVALKAQDDLNRFPIMIQNEKEELIGFFCLHINDGPKLYGFTGKEYGLIRGYSIDERFQNKGVASNSFKNIFEFIDREISTDLKRLVLGVNVGNFAAQKAYHKAGFHRLPISLEGRVGPLVIMELENKHHPSL